MVFTLSLADEERLSEMVKTLYCLYDKTTKGYKEKDVSENAWNKVVEQLNLNEDDLYLRKLIYCYYVLHIYVAYFVIRKFK